MQKVKMPATPAFQLFAFRSRKEMHKRKGTHIKAVSFKNIPAKTTIPIDIPFHIFRW